MTVRELMELLEDEDPDAKVLIASQVAWPFEYSVAGIANRQEVSDASEEDEPGNGETDPSDVFIVEGQQLRYGDKATWQVVHK